MGLFQKSPLPVFVLSGSKVELVLDLSFTAGHQGDTLASAWAVTDGKGEPIGPRMVLEVVHLGLYKKLGEFGDVFVGGLLSTCHFSIGTIYTCGQASN